MDLLQGYHLLTPRLVQKHISLTAAEILKVCCVHHSLRCLIGYVSKNQVQFKFATHSCNNAVQVSSEAFEHS